MTCAGSPRLGQVNPTSAPTGPADHSAPTGPADSHPVPAAGLPGGPAAVRPGMRSGLGHLPVALLVSLAVAVLGALIGWLVAGAAAALGLAAGVLLVAVSYVVSTVVVIWADTVNPRLVLPVGMATYVIKFTLLFFLMLAVVGTGWAGTAPMGIGVIIGVFGWTAALWWSTLRARNPYLDLPPGPPPGPERDERWRGRGDED